ncbi:MAG TPA: hypothetical protein VKJ65_10125 [Phycisphaerae bacterium]|nr:hypothetical protein [Phycisphaerae bacterium]
MKLSADRIYYGIGRILIVALLAASIICCSNRHIRADSGAVSGSFSFSFGTTKLFLNPSTGDYAVSTSEPAWTFSGHVGSPVSNFAPMTGQDNLGSYFQCGFDFTSDGQKAHGILRVYKDSGAAMIGVQGGDAATAFPNFTSVPEGLHLLTFKNVVHSPPSFTGQAGSMPLVLFDDHYNTVVISPASDFMLSNLIGDSRNQISAALNPGSDVSKSSEARWTILTFGQGIQNTLRKWGRSLTTLYAAQRPDNESNVILRDFGYWTDNGASYYYNYDPKLGYADTLLATADEFKTNGVPLGYMELDSWWYSKTYTFVDGTKQKPKASQLPPQDWSRTAIADWNRYGGTWEYRATPELFPDGLAAFDQKLGIPLIVHARWIDPKSPYHEQYDISGVAPVDPAWWKSTAAYLADSGVISYEQDWLNNIYKYSPQLQTSTDTANHFTGGMSDSMSAHNISLIYCMALPRLFLQGSSSTEVSIIRCSGDRLEQGKWQDFLYTSSLAGALGIWPWTDTFFSKETGNILLSTLSAGPVGVGDAMGSESWDNIRGVIRADGRIVKPDAPLTPLDQTILADAEKKHQPLLAATFSDQGIRTVYLFAWRRKGDSDLAQVNLSDLNLSDGKYVVYDYMNHTVRMIDQNTPLRISLASNQWQYDIIAPVTETGIAVLGDLQRFVPMGRERIADASADKSGVHLEVILSQNEPSVSLTCYTESPISAAGADAAAVTNLRRDASTGLCTFTIQLDAQLAAKADFDKTVHIASIVLAPPSAN